MRHAFPLIYSDIVAVVFVAVCSANASSEDVWTELATDRGPHTCLLADY